MVMVKLHCKEINSNIFMTIVYDFSAGSNLTLKMMHWARKMFKTMRKSLVQRTSQN